MAPQSVSIKPICRDALGLRKSLDQTAFDVDRTICVIGTGQPTVSAIHLEELAKVISKPASQRSLDGENAALYILGDGDGRTASTLADPSSLGQTGISTFYADVTAESLLTMPVILGTVADLLTRKIAQEKDNVDHLGLRIANPLNDELTATDTGATGAGQPNDWSAVQDEWRKVEKNLKDAARSRDVRWVHL